uniref:G-protein coupled receptors family 1 profile domain-containing protein n=2 Tax=Latimeria chalumnae TaxID=7897 RepID=H3APC8_LATCH
NLTFNDSKESERLQYNRRSRLISLVVLFVMSMVGNLLVTLKIVLNWRNRRVDVLFLNLAAADLCVALMTLLSQIIWEGFQDVWLAGDVTCRLVKVAQIFGLVASSNMIVVVALERQRAIVSPLHLPLPIRKLCVFAWGCALLLSSPQAFVFKVTQLNSTKQCLNTLMELPKWHFQVYIIYGAVVVFFIPFCILCFTYSRILWTIWSKESQTRADSNLGKTLGRASNPDFSLNPTNSFLPKAKVKTLKMTLVIILCFIVCGLPYFVIEMKCAFGSFSELDEEVTAVLGIFVVSNSVVNPFVYLFFNSKYTCLQKLERTACCSCIKGSKESSGRSTVVSSGRTDLFSFSSERVTATTPNAE